MNVIFNANTHITKHRWSVNLITITSQISISTAFGGTLNHISYKLRPTELAEAHKVHSLNKYSELVLLGIPIQNNLPKQTIASHMA